MNATTGITVTASGSASGAPDRAILQFAAETTAPTVQSAVEHAMVAIGAMREALVAAGVAVNELVSTDAFVHREHERGARRYVARFALAATVHDVARAGTVAQAALTAGGDDARLEGLSFTHSDPSGLRATARELAFANARAKAEQLAGLAGQHLGPVEEMLELDRAGGPPAVPVGRLMGVAQEAMSFDAGEQEVTVALTVRWAWA